MSFVADALGLTPDAPDTSGMNAAAVANAEVGRDALNWYKQIYAEQAPARELAASKAYAVSDAQLASMKQNDSISNDYWNYQKGTFRPLEQGLVADAQNYDTQARRDQEASKAIADVGMQMAATQAAQQRALQRQGVNPASGKMLAMSNQNALAEASAKAGAAGKARQQVELQGYARKMDAANMGRNLASNQATSAGVALNAGNSSAYNAGIPLYQSNQAAQTAGQGYNTAIYANNSAGSIYGNMANIQNQATANQDRLFGDLGQAAAMVKWSDKNKKKNIQPVTDDQALEAVKNTPVSTWDYKPGVADGGSHVGPMAQHVQATMGDKAAPGGKMIDLVSLNGINMAATAALARKVDEIAKKVGA